MKMKKTVKMISLLLVMSMLLVPFCGCGGKDAADPKTTGGTADVSTEAGDHPLVKITMKDGGSFTIELYPEYAPETVENFLSLVNSGFYDGLTFHRVVDNFMAQAGSATGDGISDPNEKTIYGEFSNNGFTQNTLLHERGTISMARTSFDNNSASTQFFICYAPQSFLDGDYAAFGKVIDGMDVVDTFTTVERTVNSSGEMATPVVPIVMEKAEVVS